MIDDDTNTIATGQFRSFFERWERLEEAKREVSDDLKEMFAEMKGVGFDTKVARAVFRDMVADQAEKQEFDAVYDLYWSALNPSPAQPARSAHVESITQIGAKPTLSLVAKTEPELPAHDVETGELIEENNPDPQFPGADDGQCGTPSDPAEGAKSGGLIPAVDQGGAAAAPGHRNLNGSQAVTLSNPSDPLPVGGRTDAPAVSDAAAVDALNSDAVPPIASEPAGARSPSNVPATLSDDDVPQFLRKSQEPPAPRLNPDCQKAARGEHCSLSHSMASCSKCANAAMLAKQGRAA